MTLITFLGNSLRYYWRSHLGVLLGVLVGSAVLSGALVVGDSVKGTLRDLAVSRLGKVDQALMAGSRLFRAALATDLGREAGTEVAPVLALEGTAIQSGTGTRANRVQVRGVDDRFWKLAPTVPEGGSPQAGAVWINRRLANRLGVTEGDDLLLRVEKPSILTRDAPLSTVEDLMVALRARVGKVLEDDQFGRFSLQANQVEPYNLFLSLEWLGDSVGQPGQANLLLEAPSDGADGSVEELNSALAMSWRLPDANLEIVELPTQGAFELRTSRVFIDDPLARASLEAATDGQKILTYFVNRLSKGDRSIPYSIVTGLEPSKEGRLRNPDLVPPDMKGDEIVLNHWTAQDLEAGAGDEIELAYFVAGSKRTLLERTRTFRVRGVVPIEGAADDPDLMPAFPGLHDSENCRDWSPGIPIRLDQIRDRDEEYWDAHRGTPKAFVTLAAAEEMWRNRFGTVTAIRYPSGNLSKNELEQRILSKLNPASIGLFFQPIRERALAASTHALDFGRLFLGFSFFLIVASLLLLGLLFVFGIEQRSKETGTLLALGFSPKVVRKIYQREGLILAILGSLAGTCLGLGYAQAVIYGLSTLWKSALGAETTVGFHYQFSTLIAGFLFSVLVSVLALRLSLRKQFRRTARDLLTADLGGSSLVPVGAGRVWKSALVGVAGTAAAAGLMAMGGKLQGEAMAELFFGSGAVLLLSSWALCYAWLGHIESRVGQSRPSLSRLGISNTVRRRGRSLACILLLACGSFLVIAVGANRHDPAANSEQPSSGTGGFGLYGRSTLPVFHDLNTEEGLNQFGLSKEDLGGGQVVQIRLREGDDASCLNLNRAQTPTLLGVDPDLFAERHSFSFASTADDPEGENPWKLLLSGEEGQPIPAIADYATILWALGKKVGDTLDYVDERGQLFRVRLVAALANSVFQGNLLISEQAFLKKFPSAGGYQVFLVDSPRESRREVAEQLENALLDFGLETTPAAVRLAEFSAVENTYLSIFQSLGGLGLLLGSIGLGVIVLRNVLERRAELATLRAVGFRNRDLRWMVFSEHWMLLFLGVGSGALCGLVAVLPAVLSHGSEVPYGSLSATLLLLLASGCLWIWGATGLALRGSLIESLRSE